MLKSMLHNMFRRPVEEPPASAPAPAAAVRPEPFWLKHLPGENYFEVLGRIHAYVQPRTYVEIGVAKGQSIRLVQPGTRAIGVDPEPQIAFELPSNVKVYTTTSDAFFGGGDVHAELGGLPIDLAFIDGMHHFEFALRDFINIERLASPASTVLIHDVYPWTAETAARKRTTGFWTGDVWRVVALLRKHRPDLTVRTIATGPSGLAIVRRLDPASTLLQEGLAALVEEGLSLDLESFVADRPRNLALLSNDWSEIRAILDAPPAARAHPPA